MSKLITSTVVLDGDGLQINQVLRAFKEKGWIACRDGMPLLFSISDVDLTDEMEAFSRGEIDNALRRIQGRVDDHKQFSLSLSSESRGTISIFGEYQGARWVLSCHYSCSGLRLGNNLMNLNEAADIFVLTLLDGGFKVSEYAVMVIS
jgi:hypothetical protein